MSARAIGAASLLTLVTFVIFLGREMFPEWRRYQVRYATATGSAPAIRQVLLPSLGRVDRCVTCHAAPDEGLVGAGKIMEAHPGRYLQWHPVERFGCTACHGGQGVATTYEGAAHKPIPHWDTPLRGPGEIESSCGVCHWTETVPYAPILSKGRELIRRSNCIGCHKVPGLEGVQSDAPSLDRVGEKLRRGWIARWLTDPRAYSAVARMPRFRLEPGEVSALTEYLLSLVSKGYKPALLPTGGDSDRGGALFRESRCISCHRVQGKGGRIAPELEHVASKARPEWIASFLADPHSFRPATPMLRYEFTTREIADLWAYLINEFVDENAPKDPPDRAPDAALARKGQELFASLGCVGCHGDPQGRPRVLPGPDLSKVGARDPASLEFGAARGVRRSILNYVFLKVKSPTFQTTGVPAGLLAATQGVTVTAPAAQHEEVPAAGHGEAQAVTPARMPDFRFSDEDAYAIAIALLSYTGESPPANDVVPAVRPAPYEPGGEFGRLVKKFRCLSCHVIQGAGYNLSTVDLTREGSRARKEWIRQYLLVPYSLRPVLEERMPVFRMSPAEADLLSDYISKVFVDDSIPDSIIPDLTEGEAARGGILFSERGCIACHILGKTGGYVGPSLNGAGQRLRPGFIYRWVLSPRSQKPGTRDPEQGFTEEEARALTAFLMQQKEGEWLKNGPSAREASSALEASPAPEASAAPKASPTPEASPAPKASPAPRASPARRTSPRDRSSGEQGAVPEPRATVSLSPARSWAPTRTPSTTSEAAPSEPPVLRPPPPGGSGAKKSPGAHAPPDEEGAHP